MSPRRWQPLWLPVAALALSCGVRGTPGDPRAPRAAEEGWPLVARLVALESGSPGRVQHFRAGMALMAVGLKSCALRRFEQVVSLGPGPFYAEAMNELSADLAFPMALDWSAQRRPDLVHLAAKARGPWAHKLGLHFLRRGQLAVARQLLGRSSDQAQSRYLLAIIDLFQGKLEQARDHLGASLELATRGEARQLREVAELAQLALARLDTAERHPERAVTHYLAVPLGSPHFFRARQELAWLYLQRGDLGRAVAQSVILRSPELARYYYPDGALIRAEALLGRCQFEEARELARDIQRRVVRSLESLALFLRLRPEARHYYLEAMAAAAGQGQVLDQEQVRALLADAGFRRVFELVRQLQLERGLLARAGAGGRLAPLVAELDQRLIAAQGEAGEVTRRVLAAVAADLRVLRQRSEELLFEVEQRGAAAAIGRRSRSSAAAVPGPTPSIGGAQGARWPFSGELWSDEVNELRVRVPSRCPGGPKRPQAGK